jgi:hypothetical protein
MKKQRIYLVWMSSTITKKLIKNIACSLKNPITNVY